MATPDIATRLLLASDEALADEARDLAEQLNAENIRRQQEEAAIVAEARQDRRQRPRDRRPDRAGRGRRGLASRRDRHRREQAGRRLSPARRRAVDRGRRGARVVPQHPLVRHARRRSSRARRCWIASAATRSPPGWRCRASGCASSARAVNAYADDAARTRRLAAAAAHRRPPGLPRSHRPGRRADHGAGAVRRRQPQAGLRRHRRGDRRWPAQAEGAAPQDGGAAGRARAARDRLARRRTLRLSRGPSRAASTSRIRSSRTSSTARPISSWSSPTSGRRPKRRSETASAAVDGAGVDEVAEGRAHRRGRSSPSRPSPASR